jgi:hypothetical protein
VKPTLGIPREKIYLVDFILYPAIVLLPSCFPEKVGVNKKTIIKNNITVRNKELS